MVGIVLSIGYFYIYIYIYMYMKKQNLLENKLELELNGNFNPLQSTYMKISPYGEIAKKKKSTT